MGDRGTPAEVGARVDLARRKALLTQEELSLRTGIAYNTLRRRLAHPEAFTVDELLYIADACNTSFEWLVSGTEAIPA